MEVQEIHMEWHYRFWASQFCLGNWLSLLNQSREYSNEQREDTVRKKTDELYSLIELKFKHIWRLFFIDESTDFSTDGLYTKYNTKYCEVIKRLQDQAILLHLRMKTFHINPSSPWNNNARTYEIDCSICFSSKAIWPRSSNFWSLNTILKNMLRFCWLLSGMHLWNVVSDQFVVSSSRSYLFFLLYFV